MSKITDAEANATSLDGLVNDNALVPTLRNGPKPSYQYLVDGWTTEVNDLLDRTAGVGTENAYETTVEGIAATVDGDYFSVVSADDEKYLDLYKNESEVAVFKKSYPSAEAVYNAELKTSETSPAGYAREPIISVTDGVVSADEDGTITWVKGAVVNPVMEFDKGIVSSIECLEAYYLSVGNIGDQSVYFGLRGGAYGRFILSDGNGTFTNLTGTVTIAPEVGYYVKAQLLGGNIKVWQKALEADSYTLVLDYNLSLLSRPETSTTYRGLGFVYNGVTVAKNCTYGNIEKLPAVSSKPDISNNKDALSLKGASEIIANLESQISDLKGGRLITESDITSSYDVSYSVVGGDVSVTKGTTTYPAIIINSDSSKIEYEKGNVEYILISSSADLTSSIIVTIAGGGAGNFFRFDGGETFTNLSAVSGYNNTVSTNIIRQSITSEGDMLIEGKSTDSDEFDTIALIDYSATGTLLDSKDLGFVVRFDGLAMSNCYSGGKPSSAAEKNWLGKSWVAMGDSITEQARYVTRLSSQLEVSTTENLGLSGKTITPVDATSISEQWKDITGTPDLITVFGGTNDFGTSKPIGAISDAANSATFYGGLKYIAENVITNYPSSRFFFINVLHRDWQGGGQSAGLVNANGDTVDDYNDAIKAVCRLYSVPCIDLYENAGISIYNIDTYTYDRLHLNDDGGQRVADYLYSVINTYKN